LAAAGAEMRRTLGTAVFSGMIGVTFFGIFLTPVYFYVIRSLVTSKVTAQSKAASQGKLKTVEWNPSSSAQATG
jgi:hypothetical protein